MALNGLSVILAVVGGAAFCVIIVATLLFGNKLGEDQKASEPLIAEPPADEAYEGIGSGSITVPGTLVLAMVFFVTFAVYYFVNWKYLAQTWGIS
jgi:cytochrome c oxidase subunit 1